MTTNINLPPQAIEAEMAVLGSMLIEKDAVEKALDVLHENDFYQESHRKIFRAMASLVSRNHAVDVVTVGEELRKAKALDEAGGKPYLVELTSRVTTAAHIEHYARIVKEKAVLRDLIRASTAVVSSCYAESKGAGEILDEAQSSINKISESQAGGEIIEMKSLTHEAFERIEKSLHAKQSVTGVPSGIIRLDGTTTGFQGGELVLVAGRPGHGKTAFGLNIAMNVVLGKKPKSVLFFSLEMNRHALMDRLVASRARVDLRQLRTGHFRRDRWQDITNALAQLQTAPLYVTDRPGMPILSIRAETRLLNTRLKKETGHGLGLVVIDYLQLVTGPRRENRQQEVAEISKNLKFLARDLDIPVIALAQLNRRSESQDRGEERPKLSDLRESGSLEQDADMVLIVYRKSLNKPDDPTLDNQAEIIVAKNRQGPTDVVKVSFIREYTLFGNLVTDAPPEGDEGSFQEAQESFA
ncbi:MAG: replicative DNA helicase [Elusimicrobia bacterium]|nr:replicative DNA helicase [Elusimicrobiota bacterium]